MSQPSPLLAYRQHAQALLGSADLAGARAVLEQAVDAGRSTLGEDDPEVLATLHQLAQVHLTADDPAAARRILEEAYAAGQWRLGDNAPLMLEISFDLGLVAEELGNRHEARKAFGRVAGAGADVLGADHWAVQRARAYLGGDPPAGPPDQPGPERPGPIDPEPVNPPPHGLVAYEEQRPALTEATVAQPLVPRPPPATPPPAPPPPAPAPPIQHIVPTRPAPPDAAGPVSAAAPYRRKGVALYAAVAASLGVVIAVVALVFVLANRNKSGDDVPTLSGPPPTDVRLADHGSTIEVAWADPANGTSTFLVTMAHPGEVLRPVTQVGPGQTTYRLTGLSSKLDYCFVVVAVYGTNRFAKSALTCTRR